MVTKLIPATGGHGWGFAGVFFHHGDAEARRNIRQESLTSHTRLVRRILRQQLGLLSPCLVSSWWRSSQKCSRSSAKLPTINKF
jgi:hypothetical protein